MIKLIITGKPGTGKSVLAKYLTENDVKTLYINETDNIDTEDTEKYDVIICYPDRIPEITAMNGTFVIGKINDTDLMDIPENPKNLQKLDSYQQQRNRMRQTFVDFDIEWNTFREKREPPENGKYIKGNIRATFELDNDYTKRAIGVMVATIMCTLNRLENITHIIKALADIRVIELDDEKPENDICDYAVETAFDDNGVFRLMSDYIDTHVIQSEKTQIIKSDFSE